MDNSLAGAQFSRCRQYRYALWRIWDVNRPKIMFIGLNPSTANETTDDPTIRKVKEFARRWGYGGVFMANLFAFVTPYPTVLSACIDPLGDTDEWLGRISEKCEHVVFAWGNFPQAQERAKEVIKMFPTAFALQVNKNGSPKHPLYIPYSVKPVLFQNSLDNQQKGGKP